MQNFKLKTEKTTLLLFAGFAWLFMGTMLLKYSIEWLFNISYIMLIVLLPLTIIFALIINSVGFITIVNKNIDRIFAMSGKQSIFAFIPWQSYITIIVMIAMGKTLKQSILPKQYLAVLYGAIGIALIISSMKYIKAFIYKK